MIAAIPNIIGWLAISFAKVRYIDCSIFRFNSTRHMDYGKWGPKHIVLYKKLTDVCRIIHFSTWEDCWKGLVWE